jgi:MFS family permease
MEKGRGKQNLKCKKCVLLTFILLSCLFFTGIIFGYAPLLLMLEREGVYAELCNSYEPTPCVAQSERFSLCFTLACFILSFLSLPAGIFLDNFGPRYTMMFSSAFVFTGLLGFAYADSKHFDIFLPSFILLASGGIMIMMSSFPVSFLLPKYQAGILASISCLFDASSLIFSIFLQLNINFGLKRKQLFTGYAFVSLFILLPPIFLWKEMEKQILNDGDNDDKEDEKIADKESNGNFQDMEDLQLDSVIGDGKNEYTNGNYSSCNNKNAFTPVHQRNFIGQIKSVEFLFIMLFASMQMLKANTYLVSNFLTFEIFQYALANIHCS